MSFNRKRVGAAIGLLLAAALCVFLVSQNTQNAERHSVKYYMEQEREKKQI